MLQRNTVKCNCPRLKYLVLCNKRVIALILRNIVPRNISCCTRLLVQYDILRRTIFLNISAITLYYWTPSDFVFLQCHCLFVLVMGFNNIFVCYIVVISLSGGNWRKPPTCLKPLTNFNT